MKRIAYFSLFICLLQDHPLLAQDNLYHIKVENYISNFNELKISDIGKSIEFIPLETSEGALIKEIKKICIEDGFIFISADTRILQFDQNGNFIRQIGKVGRGPEEYSFITDFCVDRNNNRLIVLAPPNKVLIFEYSGLCKNSFNLPFRGARITSVGKGQLLYYCYNTPGSGFPSWVMIDHNGNIMKVYKNSVIRTREPGFIVNKSPLYTFNNTQFLMEFGTDTLYYIRGYKKEPYASFDFGKYKMNPDVAIDIKMIKEARNNPVGKLWVSDIIENSRFLFVSFAVGITDIRMNALFIKRTGELIFLKDNEFKNDLTGGLSYWPRFATSDEILIDYKDSFDLLKSIIPGELRKKISETSNPVLMVLRN